MKKLFIVGFLLILCGLNVSAQNKKGKLVWETAKITDIEYIKANSITSYVYTDPNEPVTSLNREQKKEFIGRDDTESVRFETSDLAYSVYRTLGIAGPKGLKLKSGDTITFAVKDDRIYIKTPTGRKEKFFYIGNSPKK